MVWIVALATLAAFTANPVVLNQAQLVDADVIVVAEPVDAASGKFNVAESMQGGLQPGDAIVVEDLPAKSIRSGERYLLPLTRRGGSKFRVTELVLARDEDHRPTSIWREIYPATPELVATARSVVERTTEATKPSP